VLGKREDGGAEGRSNNEVDAAEKGALARSDRTMQSRGEAGAEKKVKKTLKKGKLQKEQLERNAGLRAASNTQRADLTLTSP